MSNHDPSKESGFNARFALAEVVNVKDDPNKAGRAQIRLVGHQSDTSAIPDKDLIWGTPMQSTSSAGFKGVGTSARLLPGSTVMVMIQGGPEAQEYIIMGSMGNQQKDGDTADTNPAVHGVGATFKSPKPPKLDQMFGFEGNRASEFFNTNKIRKLKQQARKRDKDKVAQAHGVTPAGGSGKDRIFSRFGGENHASIGANLPFDTSQNAQNFIKNKIQNKSAVIPEALAMLEQLKSVSGSMNPTAISAVGAQNLFGAIQSLAKLFPKPKKKDNEKTEEDLRKEELLLSIQRQASETGNKIV